MLEVLLRKTSFLVLFAEKALAEIPSSASIAGDRYIEDEVVVEVNWKRIASLNVRHVKNSKQT